MNALSISFVLFLLLQANSLVTVGQDHSKSELKNVLLATDRLQSLLPLEKIYVHTDRHAYKIGDTIWFKAYVFDAGSLVSTKNSLLLFLEFHNRESEITRRLSIKIKDGYGYAQVPLTKEIFKEGEYVLRVYTNWMNNFDSAHTFRKRLYIGNADQNSWLISSNIKVNETPDQEELDVELMISDINKMPVGFRDLQIQVMDGNVRSFRKSMQTDMRGNLHFKYKLKRNASRRDMRIELFDPKEEATPKVIKIPLDIQRKSTIDLQFLPEGGNFVAGLKSVIGFKALTENGKGIDVEGIILNQKNKRVASFTSSYKGMGSFTFIPNGKEKYSAKIIRPQGIQRLFALPVAEASGTSLHIENPYKGDSLKVSIDITPGFFEAGDSLLLIGSSSGVTYFAKNIILKSNIINIDKRIFPSGIARFSLLRAETPLNERIVFIDHHDDLKVTVEPDYSLKDSIRFKLQVKDVMGKPVKATFSFSVTNNKIIGADSVGNFDIRTSLLLNAELKGEIENPGYYFSSNNERASAALDHLMLTQGWVGYQWKDVFNPPVLKVQPEKAGSVVNIKQIVFNEEFYPRLVPWFLNGDSSKFDFAKMNLLRNNTEFDGNMLKEVKVRGKKRNYNGFNKNGIGYADIVLDSVAIELSETKGLYELLKQKIPGLTIDVEYLPIENRQGYNLKIGDRWVRLQLNNDSKMLFLTNTPQELKNKLNRIKAKDISLAEIMYSQKYLNAYYPPSIPKPFVRGATHRRLEKYAKAGVNAPGNMEKLFAIITITFFDKKKEDPNPLSLILPRKFYVPTFVSDAVTSISSMSTVFWDPNVLTDEHGNAVISFFSGKSSGNYAISIQGADMQGSIGSYKTNILVKKR